MKYICAQPAIKYFAWQIDVFIHSLIKQGINENDIHIISGIQHLGIDEYFSIYSDDEKSIDNEKPEGFPFGEDPLDDFPKIREQNVTGTGASFNAGDGAGYATPNAFADNEDDWKNKNSKYTE